MAYTLLLIRPITMTRRLLTATLWYNVLKWSFISLFVARRIKMQYLKYQCFVSCSDIGWLGNTDVTVRYVQNREYLQSCVRLQMSATLCVNEGRLSSIVFFVGCNKVISIKWSTINQMSLLQYYNPWYESEDESLFFLTNKLYFRQSTNT